MEHGEFYELPEYSAILSFVDAIFSELNIGLLIYHQDTPDEASSLKLIYANREASKATDTDLQALVGKYILDAFPDLDKTGLPAAYSDIIAEQEARSLGSIEYGDSHVAKAKYAVRAFPMPYGCVGVVFENVSAED